MQFAEKRSSATYLLEQDLSIFIVLGCGYIAR